MHLHLKSSGLLQVAWAIENSELDSSYSETLQIAGILSLYQCQYAADDPISAKPGLLNRCTWAGNRAELSVLAEQCEEISKDGLTLDTVCELIAKLGNERMKDFNLQIFMAICGNLGPDLMTGHIALEYPPYWVYILVLALSGAKVPLIYQLNNNRLTNEGRTTFLNNLLASDSVFGCVR